jgi:hypothetical protein
MSALTINKLEELISQGNLSELFNTYAEQLTNNKDYHTLFDLQMLKKKNELGLPLGNPTVFKDVTAEHRKEFEATYTSEARRIGQLFLDDHKFPDAWLYFRILGDIDPVYQALEQLPLPKESCDQTDELIQLAVYQKVHPVRGLQMMLATSGMCNTVTACDQVFHDLTSEQRQGITKILVQEMYAELVKVLQRDIKKKVPLLPPGKLSLEELITGRDWLFEDNNYHVDVSHLNAVVRFSRSLSRHHPELEMARELALYGSHLAAGLQYTGEIPFVDFYPAHLAYFQVVMEQNTDEGLAYFEQQLTNEPDSIDQQLIAYVLVDLYVRVNKIDLATQVANKHLTNLTRDAGFSFKEFCLQHHRYTDLLSHATEHQDPFLFLTAKLEQSRANSGQNHA